MADAGVHTGRHSNWMHLCVFLGLDVGFDAGWWSTSHAALMDCVLADWKVDFKKNKIISTEVFIEF